jgi:hypothetical protein
MRLVEHRVPSSAPADVLLKQFEVGKIYSTRSIADYDTIFSFEILSRTPQTVMTKVHGKIVRRRIAIYGGCEQFRPFGTYSMCAVIRADQTLI